MFDFSAGRLLLSFLPTEASSLPLDSHRIVSSLRVFAGRATRHTFFSCSQLDDDFSIGEPWKERGGLTTRVELLKCLLVGRNGDIDCLCENLIGKFAVCLGTSGRRAIWGIGGLGKARMRLAELSFRNKGGFGGLSLGFRGS